MVTELWGVQCLLGKQGDNNQRGITRKLNSLYLKNIAMKFYEDIPKGYQVIGCTRMKITQH